MKVVLALLSKLRAAGGSLQSEGGRLIVEAPHGVITEELRAELVRLKPEILTILEADTAVDVDVPVTEAIRETIGLLATAYRRYSAIRRVGADPRNDSGDGELANSGVRSVHGVVP